MISDTPLKYQGIIFGNYYEPSSYKLILKDVDYASGYIKRYFVGRINFQDIFETDEASYNLTTENFYRKLKVNWKITGPEYNVYEGKMLSETGVINYNKLRIKELNEVFKDVSNVVNDPKQYWRGY